MRHFRDSASRPRVIIAVLAALLSTPVLAVDYVVHVHGMVCSFCAQGVTRNVSRLSYIDQTQYTKGVRVEIEIQKVTIAVKPDEEVDFGTLFEAIRSAGYDPVDVWTVTPDGEVDEIIYQP